MSLGNIRKKSIIWLVILLFVILTTMALGSVRASVLPTYAGAVNGFSVSDGIKNELNGEFKIDFDIERDNTSQRESIDFCTMSGTAIGDVHYHDKKGRLYFEIGEAQKTVSINIISANAIYGKQEATRYTNIDRTFYLRIYNTSQGSPIAVDMGSASIPRENDFEVASDIFSDGYSFLSHNFNGFNSCQKQVFGIQEYYREVGNGLSLQLDLEYCSVEDAKIIVGLLNNNDGEPPQLNGGIEDLGGCNYAAGIRYGTYIENPGLCIEQMPFHKSIGEVWTNHGEKYITQGYSSNTDIVQGYILLPLQDYFLLVSVESGSPYLYSINVSGKVIDNEEPSLLGIAPITGSYNANDDIYISLIFDEIVTMKSTDECNLTTNSGDFEYVEGVGSNVLVFRGNLNDTIEKIEIYSINNDITDYAGNTINSEDIQAEVLITKEGDTQQFDINFYVRKDFDLYQSQQVLAYGYINEPEHPFRLGYRFDGWKDYSTDDFFDLSQQITSDVNLYADWTSYFMPKSSNNGAGIGMMGVQWVSDDATGTKNDPFLISTYEHLQNFSSLFRKGSTEYNTYKDKHYKLYNNIIIDNNADEFNPVGVAEIVGETIAFSNFFEGTFDGDGYFIENIKINALFASFIIVNKGTITSLGINGEIIGEVVASGIALSNAGTIEKCINKAHINTAEDEAMLAGIAFANFDMYNHLDWLLGDEGFPSSFVNGNIKNCYNLGVIGGDTTEGFGISGLLGEIENCFNVAVFNGVPISEMPESVSNCFYSVTNFGEQEYGTPLSTFQMLGENSSTHTNVLYNNLPSADWVLRENDGDKWYLPNLSVFDARGMDAVGFYRYKITYEFDNDIAEPLIEYFAEGDRLAFPNAPTKQYRIFAGWFVVEDGNLYEIDFECISSELVLRAKWVKYVLEIEGSTGDLELATIEIAEGLLEDTEVVIPKDITAIRDNAFDVEGNERIISIVFENGSTLISIGQEAFKGTSITTIILPASIKNVNAQSFWGVCLDEVIVQGGGDYISIDGVLYLETEDDFRLVYYPLNKDDEEFSLFLDITSVGNYAFLGGEDEHGYYGNPYITYLELNENLTEVEDFSLYGLSSLTKVLIHQTAPQFDSSYYMFKYCINSVDTINSNLIIEVEDYSAFINYKDTGEWWLNLSEYFSYKITITFDYQNASGNNAEITRTRVDGDESNEYIRNGTPIGVLPRPYRFGYDFVQWRWDDEGNIKEAEDNISFDRDITVFAAWKQWDLININYDENDRFLINGQPNDPTASILDIISVEGIISIFFEDIIIEEQITLTDIEITLRGNIIINCQDAAFILSEDCSIWAEELSTESENALFLIKSIFNSGSELNYSRFAGNQLTFLPSDTSDTYIYIDRAVATVPNDDENEYNIIYWDIDWASEGKETGEVGRNQKEISFDILANEKRYSPLAKKTVSIMVEIEDTYYNKQGQSIDYTTNRDTQEQSLECQVSYYTSTIDRDGRMNELQSLPVNAGTYYFLVSREGYNDFCDAEDFKGELVIDKASITIEAKEGVLLSKVYDATNVFQNYDLEIIENTHYNISGIYSGDSVDVVIQAARFNSINVVEATKVIVEIWINSENYSVDDSFEIDGTITPYEVPFIWEGEQQYTYQAKDLSENIKAYFIKINTTDRSYVTIEFDGDSVFMNADIYTAVASYADTNYTYTNTQRECKINKAQVTVSAINGVSVNKVYDTSTGYTEELLEDLHYTVEGLFENAYVTLNEIVFNNSNVELAYLVTVYVSISDTSNYTINPSFEIGGSITPYEVAFLWEGEQQYTYQAKDLSENIKAYFTKINELDRSYATIEFDNDGIFMEANAYTATASYQDTNYTYTNTQRNCQINKAQISVSVMESAVLSKVYDGNTDYLEELIEDTHYTVAGIVDDAYIIIDSLAFNNANVEYANRVTVNISVSDTNNYTVNHSLIVDAEIEPLVVEVSWSFETSYTYDNMDFGDTVSAEFRDINMVYVSLDITFSGQNSIFKDAGNYSATVSNDDSNYQLDNEVIELYIDKKNAQITAGDTQTFVYNGETRNIVAELNHSEVNLSYQPQQGFKNVGIYNIIILAVESANYYMATKEVDLVINKAEYTNISHFPVSIRYFPDMKLCDIELKEDFYWREYEGQNPNTKEVFAGYNQQFQAYYNADSNNYEDFYLSITVNVDKLLPIILENPTPQEIILVGRRFSYYQLSGGQANIEGVFSWVNNSGLITKEQVQTDEQGVQTAEVEVRFVPNSEYVDEYDQLIFMLEVEVNYLQVTFNSYEHQEVIEVVYNEKMYYEDFPIPADKTGYAKDWEIKGGTVTITDNTTITAVYTLLNPVIAITGYTAPIIYGEDISLQVSPEHDLSTVEFSYLWYFGSQVVGYSNAVEITDVNQSGLYKVIVETTDGQQESYAEDTIEIIIKKAAATIDADAVQTFTYDGSAKNVEAYLNHSETELIYSEYDLIIANEDGYIIDIIANETPNYELASLQVTLKILKATIPSLVFADKEIEYDGQMHSIKLANESLAGIINIEYENNEIIDVGAIEVTAIIEYDTQNYNEIEPTMSATLTIKPRPVHILLTDKSSVYGQPIVYDNLAVVTEGDVIDGDELGLIVTKETGEAAGKYKLSCTIDNTNYLPIIVDGVYTIQKAVIDMQGITFMDKCVMYDTKSHIVLLEGQLPELIQVTYKNNQGKNAGIYNAKASFFYDEQNYEQVPDMIATLTIKPREISVVFSYPDNLYYDGKIKEGSAIINNIPIDETDTIKANITYNKVAIEPGYYTATISVDNTNYVLVGDTIFEFTIYQKEVQNIANEEANVVIYSDKGLLPDINLNVISSLKRAGINTGVFSGKERKQTFEISMNEDAITENDSVTIKLLIDRRLRHIDDLKLGRINADGEVELIDCQRIDDYFVFETTSPQGEYTIVGEGKGSMTWIIAIIAGGVALIGVIIVVSLIIKKKKKRQSSQIIG